MTIPNSMSVDDWLELLQTSVQETASCKVWIARHSDQPLYGPLYGIRTEDEVCPLCFIATASGSTKAYKAAWHLALVCAFGTLDIDSHRSAAVIAYASDFGLKVLHEPHRAIRLRIGEILNIPKDQL